MPLENVRYRTKTTSKGPVRLAFPEGSNKPIEAKNLDTSATHTPADFARDARRSGLNMLRKKG